MPCSATKRLILLLGIFLAPLALRAADFEIGPVDSEPAGKPVKASHRSSDELSEGIPPSEVPTYIQAGDVQTAYGLKKYELRTDLRFHDGGGILGKAYLGLFSRFFLGGAVEVRNAIGSGDVRLRRDDAQLLARLLVLKEDEAVPALAIGWDGPAYERGEAKGLYLAVSKELATNFAFVQFHGGLNSANAEQFEANRDLRASFGVTTAVHNVGLFTEVDEVLNAVGSRWNAGLQVYFSPITLGLEFRDLASIRPNTLVSRLLKVSWNGRF